MISGTIPFIAYDFEECEGLMKTTELAVTEYVGAYNHRLSDSEKKKKIAALREINKQSNRSSSYSRECGVCFTNSPVNRAVLGGCGHTLCLACALTLENIALRDERNALVLGAAVAAS
ncbi:hypothetical protein PRIPAC_94716 [Pristionchus pacificus]|uniref:Uncharacterized protein n=1 Tax=Pristionchus pacificus TaxID=54126 RepID=A0A2A6CDR5_PRIPA|nr:hypothetical protein PRIPAC_94716 [Pristionchus pacificus]|eukprot:PDM76228.1 hypothetical protein PRIPAC_39832 [Pristionchus pacificus]